MKRIIILLVFLVAGSWAMAQNTISGTVTDTQSGEALIGASVFLRGSSNGTVTDWDGSFTLDGVPTGAQTLLISYVGYETRTQNIDVNGNVNLGSIGLATSAIGLGEVTVVGVVDLVKDRQTPVAVSTIRSEEIELKLGNQEFPEIMKTTPSVYATKSGGGYGDSRINVRGFDQRNVSVIINGQPVNDMENGWVYWSNWAGLQDVAAGIEIQRGVGASRLAVPSVGGTINVVTKSTEKEQGGFVKMGIGNDGYLKGTLGLSTGRGSSGWSMNILAGGWQGDGYVTGTSGQGFNYLFGVGYDPSDKHSFNLSFIGAGQWHHQRDAWLSIRDYENYGEDGLDIKFNADHGTLDGKEYNFRRNFYNKPIATLNWDWNLTSNLTLNTALYGSWGRGGGTGPRGRNFGIYPFRKDLTQAIEDGDLSYRTSDGYIDYDAVVANNKSGTPYTGEGYFEGLLVGSNGYREDGVNRNVAIRRASINSHNWYGVISNLEYNKDRWTFGAGVDARSYRGLHYRAMNDYLGLDAYASTGNDFSPVRFITSKVSANPFRNISEAEKIDYYSIGEVEWLGGNFLAEYNDDKFSGVIQAGVSNQKYKRIDYFDSYPQESDQASMTGGFIKGGFNYNINGQHNIFGNSGYIARQPNFDAVFPNNANIINEDLENEHITSFELGYGFRGSSLRANVNLYLTTWDNRLISRSIRLEGGADGTVVSSDVKNQHQGIEVELTYDIMDNLRFTGMGSFGDWKYTDNFTIDIFDDNQDKIRTGTLYLKDQKVGDAAQTTVNLGLDWKFWGPLSVDFDWMYYNNLYADFDVLDEQFFSESNAGVIKLPAYNLFDMGLTGKFSIGKGTNNLILRANINNLLDTEYIAESNSNYAATTIESANYKGISKANYVWFGFGRTWNLSARYNF